MRGVSKRNGTESVAQIKEYKTWSGCVIKHPSVFPPVLPSIFLLFFPPFRKARLTSNGQFCADVSFLPPGRLELRRVFRLTVYLLRARVPQVIPQADRRREKPRGKSSRSEFPDTFSTIYGVTVPQNLFNYRARPASRVAHCFIRVYANFRCAPRHAQSGPQYRYQLREYRIDIVIGIFWSR